MRGSKEEHMKIESELNRCSKKILIRMILDCSSRFGITADRIKMYRTNAELEKLEVRLNEIDSEIENIKGTSIEDNLRRNALLYESIELLEKYEKKIRVNGYLV